LLWSLGAGAACLAIRSIARTAEAQRNAGLGAGKRIVILGAGFRGIAAAVELARLLPQNDNGDIVVIDEDNFLLFTPMLTEATAGEINPRHIVVGVHEFSKRISFIQGRIDHVDVKTREVTVTVGESELDPEQKKIPADQLVIALGSVTNFHHVDGAEEHCLEVKRLGDADAICKRSLASIDRALIESDPAKRKALLTFVVAGGGYTGVETIAAVNDLVRVKSVEYGLDEGQVRTVLVNPGDRLLTETSAELGEYAAEKLKQHGVEIRMNTSVKSVSSDGVELLSGERIPSHTVIWAAGVKPSPIVESLDCEKGKHGGIKVNACCQIENAPDVWALGDCAEIPQPNKAGTYAPTAQNATREGALVTKNIVSALRGEAPQPFTFKPLGELALVGRHAGAARIFGRNVYGIVAWALWRMVYLAKIPGLAPKSRVMMDWILDLFFGRDPVELGGERTRATSTQARSASGQA
jgi:NADH:quinone reductase (non-electrogenic)